MLAGGLGSWAVLHAALCGRQVDVRGSFLAALALLAAATLLRWPPLWHALG